MCWLGLLEFAEAIFSPEHGVTGTLDTTDVHNSKDAATGIPVYSVYGATDAARRPTADVMKSLDAVVIDIQDAGARFYTYETTLGYFLEAAAAADGKTGDCVVVGIGVGQREPGQQMSGHVAADLRVWFLPAAEWLRRGGEAVVQAEGAQHAFGVEEQQVRGVPDLILAERAVEQLHCA